MFQSFTGAGHLTRNPELRYTTSGTAVANTGIAFNRRYTANGESKEEVCFLDLVVFGKSAEHFAQYTQKGDPVLVRGRLQQRRWEDQSGSRHQKHELFIEEWRTLKRRGDGTHERDQGGYGDEGGG